jgi:DNA-binding MarR family transcriptional regulator
MLPMTGRPELRAKSPQAAVSDDQVDALLSASKALVGLAVLSLSELNDRLTLIQFRALVLLTDAGPLKGVQLARELGVSCSSVTRLCDRLVLDGLIRRNPNPADRREVLLTPSQKAESLVRQVMDRRRRDLRRILSLLQPADRLPVIDAVEKLAHGAGWIHGDQVLAEWPMA